jgi:hypothetical protein
MCLCAIQDQVLMSTSTSRSDPLMRFAGACLGTIGAANFAAATGGDSNFNRRMNRVWRCAPPRACGGIRVCDC